MDKKNGTYRFQEHHQRKYNIWQENDLDVPGHLTQFIPKLTPQQSTVNDLIQGHLGWEQITKFRTHEWGRIIWTTVPNTLRQNQTIDIDEDEHQQHEPCHDLEAFSHGREQNT